MSSPIPPLPPGAFPASGRTRVHDVTAVRTRTSARRVIGVFATVPGNRIIRSPGRFPGRRPRGIIAPRLRGATARVNTLWDFIDLPIAKVIFALIVRVNVLQAVSVARNRRRTKEETRDA